MPLIAEVPLRLGFEVMQLPADDGLSMVVYNAVPGGPEADGLKLLASWAADTTSSTPIGIDASS